MIQEELVITTMLNIMIPDVNQLRDEISQIEHLLTERRLLRKWVQDAEGAELFSEDLARVEAQLAEKEGQREALMEEYNRMERKSNWLSKQLELIQFRSGRKRKTAIDDDELPF